MKTANLTYEIRPEKENDSNAILIEYGILSDCVDFFSHDLKFQVQVPLTDLLCFVESVKIFKETFTQQEFLDNMKKKGINSSNG